tara:strand:+ start:1116 stop:1667 length:552 start_codon:yes stop_codon:yes gene_type:complete
MDKKGLIRKKYLYKRYKNYFEINENFFYPLIKIIKKKYKNNKIDISIYYPGSSEVDVFKLLNIYFFKNLNFFLPIIEKNNLMNFYKWKKNDILILNKYGVPEPINSKKKIPSIILLPLIAFDKKKNRIGYGKGYYDRYLNKYLKSHKKILTIGIAFSFQKHHKLPVNNKDFKLDYILTEKGLI